MPRTTPYAALHALTYHPLGPWVARFVSDQDKAERDAMRDDLYVAAGIPRKNNGVRNLAAKQAFKEIDRGALSISTMPTYSSETSDWLNSSIVWGVNGQKIFEFGEELTRELEQTDIHEVTADDLHLPMSSFYIALNMAEPYYLPNGQQLDGILVAAMIHQLAERLRKATDSQTYGVITLTFMGKNGKYNPECLPITVRLVLSHPEESLLSSFKASSAALKKFEQDPRTAQLIDGYGNPHAAPAMEEVYRRERETGKVFTDLYNLTAGALLYLTLYHDKGEQEWPAGAPAKFVQKTNGQKAEAEAAQRKLNERGWSRATYFNVAAQAGSATGEARDGLAKATHWRRGHWRRQPVGPNRAERRLTWIRPILVNSQKGVLPMKAQISKVEAPSKGQLIRPEKT